MLPCITFIFSRIACDDARDACVDAGLRLTTAEERARIRTIVDERTASLADADLDVLGFDRFLAGLEMGIAAHHAGMVPPFKEAVEACFVEGLTKAVFATETLAMGINMPARSVVIERLTKFTGERREMLTPGEYTQLTGRAGRRGIDDLGFAVVLWSPFVPFEQVAALASSRTYALRSAFRPTYNMAANLVRRYEPEQAHHLLNLSFAQFQADRAVVRLEARIERQQQRLARLRGGGRRATSATSPSTGPFARPPRRPSAPGPARRGSTRSSPRWRALQPGRRRGARPASATRCSSVAFRKGNPRLHTVDEKGKPAHVCASDLDGAARRPSGQVDLPVPYNPNNRAFQHQVADALRRRRLAHRRVRPPPDRGAAPARDDGRRSRPGGHAPPGRRLPRPRRPPPRRRCRRSASSASSTTSDARSAAGRSRWPAASTACCGSWRRGATSTGWALTEAGTVLARTYHEADLLVAEAMTSGLLDDLDVAHARRGRVLLHLRAPRPRAGAGAAVPVVHRAGALPRSSSCIAGRAGGRRGGGRAAHHAAPRRRLRPPRPRLGGGGGARRAARGRAAVGRRLRPEREAAHRPAAGHRRRGARSRPPPRAPGRRPRRCTAAWCRRRLPSRRPTAPRR